MLVIPSLPPYFLINIPQLHKRVGYQAGFDSPQTHAYTLELFGPSEVYAPHEWHFTHLVTTVVDTGFCSAWPKSHSKAKGLVWTKAEH